MGGNSITWDIPSIRRNINISILKTNQSSDVVQTLITFNKHDRKVGEARLRGARPDGLPDKRPVQPRRARRAACARRGHPLKSPPEQGSD